MRLGPRVLALVVLLAPLVRNQPLARAQLARGQEDWRVTRMDLELWFLPEEGLFLVEGRLALANASGKALQHVDLAVRDAFADEFQMTGEGLGDAQVFEEPPFEGFRRVEAPLRVPVPPDDECTLGFAYSGVLESNQFAVTPRFAYGSWVERWYPVPISREGTPSGQTPIAAGRTVLHLPLEWHGVTNGDLASRREQDGEAIETWIAERAVARSFSAGPYVFEEHTIGQRHVGVYQLSATQSRPDESAAVLGAALEAMEARFGPYPFPSFRIAEVPMALGQWGASSEQGFLLVKPSFLQTPGGNLALFAHEAAHGWWGNLVGQRGPGSILCSESLAQYGAVLAIEALEGREAATEFLRFSRPDYIPDQCARGYFRLIARGDDLPLARLEGGGWQHTLADAKGHWMFHMLRRRVGDEVFFATLRGLLAAFAGRQLTLDDLRAAFLASAPEAADLERFFAQWLDRTGAPRLEADWNHVDGRTTVTLRQVQGGEPFALRVDLALVDPDGTRRHVEMRIESDTASATLDGARPVEVLVDPEHALLLWTPEYE